LDKHPQAFDYVMTVIRVNEENGAARRSAEDKAKAKAQQAMDKEGRKKAKQAAHQAKYAPKVKCPAATQVVTPGQSLAPGWPQQSTSSWAPQAPTCHNSAWMNQQFAMFNHSWDPHSSSAWVSQQVAQMAAHDATAKCAQPAAATANVQPAAATANAPEAAAVATAVAQPKPAAATANVQPAATTANAPKAAAVATAVAQNAPKPAAAAANVQPAATTANVQKPAAIAPAAANVQPVTMPKGHRPALSALQMRVCSPATQQRIVDALNGTMEAVPPKAEAAERSAEKQTPLCAKTQGPLKSPPPTPPPSTLQPAGCEYMPLPGCPEAGVGARVILLAKQAGARPKHGAGHAVQQPQQKTQMVPRVPLQQT